MRQAEGPTPHPPPAALPERSRTTLPTNSGARAAPHAARPSARQATRPPAFSPLVESLSSRPSAREGAQPPAFSPRAAARAKELSRLPGNTSSWRTLAGSDHDPRMRWRPTRTDRTGACFPSASARAAQRPVRACANESLQPRAVRRRASLPPRVPTPRTHRTPSFAPPSTPQARYPPIPQPNPVRARRVSHAPDASHTITKSSVSVASSLCM